MEVKYKHGDSRIVALLNSLYLRMVPITVADHRFQAVTTVIAVYQPNLIDAIRSGKRTVDHADRLILLHAMQIYRDKRFAHSAALASSGT